MVPNQSLPLCLRVNSNSGYGYGIANKSNEKGIWEENKLEVIERKPELGGVRQKFNQSSSQSVIIK